MACQPLPSSAVNEDTEQELSPLSGKPMKRHEKWGLKGIAKEKHTVFWEQAVYWCKERFSEPKWREIRCRIERAAKEDNVIMLGWRPPQQPLHPDSTEILRSRLLRSSSSLTSTTGVHPLRPHLPHILTSTTPTTTRPRWDIVNSGPVTPLSATSGAKNAFAEGGIWASLSPKTPTSAASVSPTPITAVLAEPWTPEAPQDTEAKAAYDEIWREVRRIALRVCANRLGLRRSSTNGQDVIHPSMVKPKDELRATEIALNALKVDLSQALDTTLPTRIEQSADDEASYLQQYSIPTIEKLSDIDSWLQIDENTGEMTNILEAQRDLLRLNRSLRNEQDLSMRGKAVQCAWAVKILDDLEYAVDSRADSDSADSDEGYNYENFLRSIRSESSIVLSEASVAVSPAADTSARIRDNNTKQPRARHSSSPIKRTFSSFSLTVSPSRRPYPHRRPLSIHTSPSSHPIAPPKLSPEERFYRHQGPSMADLDNWADELKNMQHKRSELQPDPALHPHVTSSPALLSPLAARRRRRGGVWRNSSDSTPSWQCETAGPIQGTGDSMLRRFLNDGVGIDEYEAEDPTTPRTLSASHVSLGLDRPTHVLQRDANSVPNPEVREHRGAGRQVSRTVSFEQCVAGRQREAGEVQKWVRELERMESREKLRQMERYL